MRYKIYHPNIDQDIHPRPLTLFAESDNLEELLNKAKKTGSESWVLSWIFFYDTKFSLHLEPYRTKHGIKFRPKKVNPKYEHDYDPDKFTESELKTRLEEDIKFIFLDIESPGGSVDGTLELSERLNEDEKTCRKTIEK